MMKKAIQFMPIIAIAIGGILFSCVDSGKDLYDSSYETPNPMGEGFAAPDGFDWNMITTKNVTIEAKDEEGGQYSYIIGIYAEDPLVYKDASALATRVANKENNFKVTVPVSLFPTQKGIYIKQTDPRGREQVYPFDIPEGSINLTCKLYHTDTPQNRALASRAPIAKNASFEKPNYNTIPDGAIEISDMQGSALQPNASYKITSDYNGTFTFYGYNGEISTKVFVDAKWTVPESFTFQNGIEIIVMGNGEIISSKDMIFVRSSMLTIMDDRTVSTGNITFTNNEPAGLRNWGNLSVTNNITLSSGASLYNKGTITSKNFSINSNTRIVNDNKIELEGDFNLPSNFSLENNGEIYGQKMTAESSSVVTNNNIIIFETISFTNPTVYNTCSMEATTSFYANGIEFNLAQGYLKAPKMEFVNGNIYLNNGSMLEATTNLMLSGHTKFYGKGENASLIKSPVINGQGFTYDGNLAIETDNHVAKDQWWDNFIVQNGAYIAKIGDSKVYIQTCTGIKNGGNEGNDPKEPEFPITMDDTRNYAYLFEDQWPFYGDYDMNDVVLIIKEREIAINKYNKVVEFKLNIDLAAAGATKSIGAAIMLDGVPANAITQPVELNDNTLAKGFNLNNNQIENGQDYAVIPLFNDVHKALGKDRHEQINTVLNHSNNTNPKNISFIIKFGNPTISADEFNINKLNIFIFTEGNRNNRKEIHVVGYQPTKLADTQSFGGNNDDSSISEKRYYISKDNLAWGIMVPTDFKWPLEYVNIKTAYPLFEDWVTSGGTKNEEWWKTFNPSKIYNKD